MALLPGRGPSTRQRADEEAVRHRLRLLSDQLAVPTRAPGQGRPERPGVGPAAAPSAPGGTSAVETAYVGDGEAPPRSVEEVSTPSAQQMPAPSADEVSSPSAGRHLARPLTRRQRLAGAVRDHAPAGSYGLGAAHVAVLALVALVALAVAGWWLIGARPQSVSPQRTVSIEVPPSVGGPAPTSVPPASDVPSPAGALPPPAGASVPVSTTPPAGEVVVDVAGKVRRPGIVTLPAGSRVADALRAAGGVRPQVDTAALNLARPLVDGEQVLVGLPPVGGVPAPALPGASPTVGTTTLVNLNTATMEQLDTLPGVGPVTAQAILDWRSENGAFTGVDELLEVSGIGDATLADLRDLVTV